MSIFTRFQKQCETKEDHPDPQLRTHYYKANLKSVLKSIEEIFKDNQQAKIINVSLERGEVAAELKKGKNYFIVATIIMLRPYETAVDLSISTESLAITGAQPALKKQITAFFQALNKKQVLLGTGKNK
ncbi:hypothetical protein J9303_10550 [Bacillaceae bacterium Marseille-Q3522]|nr:hypothetical protein [Bacillaceae bacterium Marseille-Q3522]